MTELPDPVPESDEYLIEIRAAATNFFDVLQIAGKYQSQPRACSSLRGQENQTVSQAKRGS